MRRKTKFAVMITENLIWVILLVAIIIGSLTIPNFLSLNNFINIIYHSSVLGMLVLGISMCLISGQLDLSIESTQAFAPIVGVLMLMRWFKGFNPYLAILITIAVGAAVGLFNAFFVIKLKINSFLQTLVMLIILRGLCLYLIRVSLYDINPVYLVLGSAKVGNFPIAIIFLLLTYVVMHFVLTRRPIGRNMYAVGGNKNAAFISGINVSFVIVLSFVLSGVFAALAGLIMVGKLNAVASAMGEGAVFMAIAAAVLGGASLTGGEGKVYGIFAGVFLLGVIDNSLNMKGVDPNVIYTIKGFILFIAIIVDQLKMNVRSWLIRREDIYLYELRKGKSISQLPDNNTIE
jgi:ribose/xylose/arabinose/galactoside ABC-type transport system permease subunit